MSMKILKNGRVMTAALLVSLVVVAVTFWGCGTKTYTAPTPVPTTPTPAPALTATGSALIDAPTLKSWMNQGLVNAAAGEKVVIFDVTTAALYAAGHIPGAVRVDSTELTMTRLEAVADMAQMVIDGAHMDALIQRGGVDQNTTIVFTSTSMASATRLYTTFRYWGFPKNRLKVLDGLDAAWTSLAYTQSTATPTIPAPAYSVTPDGVNRVQAQLRASLGEMMDVVQHFDGSKQAIIDTLSNPANVLPTPVLSTSARPSNMYKGYPGSTSGLLPYAVAATTEYVVFEGHMKNAKNLLQSTLYSATNKFLAQDDLIAAFATIGMTSAKTAYVYCRAGNAASVEFFALDGILNWNVVWYDGSWGQWALMADKKGGLLKAGSIWNTYGLSESDAVPTTTDTNAPAYVRDATDGVTYNTDNTPVGSATYYPIQPLPYHQDLDVVTSVLDPAASQIENADKAYLNPVKTVTTGSGASSAGGAGGSGTSSGGGGGC